MHEFGVQLIQLALIALIDSLVDSLIYNDKISLFLNIVFKEIALSRYPRLRYNLILDWHN